MVEAFWDRRVISLYARPSWIVVSVRDSDRYRTASAALSNDNPIGNSQFEKTTIAISLQTPSCDRRRFLNCKAAWRCEAIYPRALCGHYSIQTIDVTIKHNMLNFPKRHLCFGFATIAAVMDSSHGGEV